MKEWTMRGLELKFLELPFRGRSIKLIRRLIHSFGGVILILGTGCSGLRAVSLETIAQSLGEAQATTDYCRDWQNNLVREWTERSRMYIQSQNSEAAAQALLRVVKVLGTSPTSQLRMETLRSLLEETPTGILQTFVELSIRQQQPETALTVLPVLLEMAQSLPTAYSAVKTQSLTAIAKHYLALEDTAQARAIFDEAATAATFLQGAEFQTKALTALAQGYRDLGDTPRAEMLLGQSLQFAQQMNHSNPIRRAWVLEPIALTYAQLGQGDQTLEVVQILRNQDPSLQSYGHEAIATVVRGYAQANQWDRALNYLNQIQDKTIQATLMAELAGQYAKTGQGQAAQRLLQQAVLVAKQESHEGGVQNNALMSVLRTYAETAGSVTEVLPLVNTLTDPGAQAMLFNTLAGLKSLEQNPEQSLALLNQGLAAAQRIEDSAQRSSLMGQLLEQHFAAKRWTIALSIIQSLPNDDPFTDKNGWLNSLATEAAKAGDWSTSLAAIDRLPEQWDDYRNPGLHRIALGYARQGNFAAALALLPRITNTGSYPYQVRTLAALAGQARLQGDLNRSQALLTQAEEITAQLDFESQRADALIALTIPLNQWGQHQKAQQLQGEALQLIQRDPGMMDYHLQEMIKQYLEAKDYNSAVQLVMDIPSIQEEQSWILNNLAEKLIEADALDIALTATNRIQKPEDKARFLVTLAAYYLTDGNLSAVTTTLDQALATAQRIPDPESRQLVFRAPPEQTIVDDPYDRASTLETIALNYAKIGQLNTAMTIAQQLQDPKLRQALLQQLSCYREAEQLPR